MQQIIVSIPYTIPEKLHKITVYQYCMACTKKQMFVSCKSTFPAVVQDNYTIPLYHPSYLFLAAIGSHATNTTNLLAPLATANSPCNTQVCID